MSELPARWTNTRLGEICSKPQYGWTSKASRAGRIKYVRTTDISNGQLDWDEVPFCELEPNDIEKFRVREDDILVSRAGSVGVSFRINDVPNDAVFASYLIRFNPLKCVLPKYIEFFLKSDKYWRAISEFSAGIAVPNVNASKLAQLEIPLAPLNEQGRIVAKLEKLLSRVDAAQARLATIPRILKRFRQSVLAAACSGRLTADWREEHPCPANENTNGDSPHELPESWSLRPFMSVSREITVGYVGPMAKEYVSSGVPFLRSLNVRPFRFDPTNIKFISADFHRTILKSRLSPGDVAIVRSGNSGIACVVPESLPEANCSDLVILRPSSELDAGYACLFMNSAAAQAHVNSVKVGIAQGHFNVGSMKTTLIPLPPLTEQQEIVRRVESLFKTADALEARYRKAKAHVDELTQSILAKAFRGELLPQDPHDEPASVLLKRIREGGSKQQKTASIGKRKAKNGVNSRKHEKQELLHS